jgi:NAD(P)-dependent dehydrogenase (short-subunit alcohol dehydrogenase family)
MEVVVRIKNVNYVFELKNAKEINGKWHIFINEDEYSEIERCCFPVCYGKMAMKNSEDFDFTIGFHYDCKSFELLPISGVDSKEVTVFYSREHQQDKLNTKWVVEQFYYRWRQRQNYDRVVKFAIDASQNSEGLLQVSEDFKFESNHGVFRFQEFLKHACTLKLDIMISGSTILQAFKFENSKYITPNDVDMYIHASCDRHETISRIDYIIRRVYMKKKIFLVRSPYIISWMIFNHEHKSVASYQLVLSPCERWEHVFAGYHSDIVCAGFLVKENVFVESARFTYWKNTDYKTPAFFFPDLVSPRYRERVAAAYTKYTDRCIPSEYVYPFDEIVMQDVARSSLPAADSMIRSRYSLDVGPYLGTILEKDGVQCVGTTLQEVYNGEQFRPIIETMSCFTTCPSCNKYTLNLRASGPQGSFCYDCLQTELMNCNKLSEALIMLKSKTALVTGGRCGIGKEIVSILKRHDINTQYTTRYLSNSGEIPLDLKDPDTWGPVKRLLEDGDINILVLSASETLHYETHEPLVRVGENLYKEPHEPEARDWTGDFKRANTGVWHKTLEQMSMDEITSPIMANIVGNAKMLAYFVEGVKRRRMLADWSFYYCIVVTSYEGAFEEKTPFHPITNACKSALEQIVWTLKAQTDFLKCKIVLSDPGWVYTEGSFGKIKGPVPIAYGASQILQPLANHILEDGLNFISPAPNTFKIHKRRKINNQIEIFPEKSNPVFVTLEPCGHLATMTTQNWLISKCSVCEQYVTNRKLYDYAPQRMFLTCARHFGLNRDIINKIERLANFPLSLK